MNASIIMNHSQKTKGLLMNKQKRRRASRDGGPPETLVAAPAAAPPERRRKSEGSHPDSTMCLPSIDTTAVTDENYTKSNHDTVDDDLASIMENKFFHLKQDMENREAELKKYCHHMQLVNMEQKARIHRFEQQVDMYQALTATSLSNFDVSDPQGPACDCTVANTTAGAVATFRLKASQDIDGTPLINYTPIKNADLLSPILRQAVAVDPNQLPAFFKDILVNMFPEHDEDAN
jgi:hypothetical protein